MTIHMAVLACAYAMVLAAGAEVSAQAPPRPKDASAVEGCIARGKTPAERRACIGTVADPCRNTQDGATTMGSIDCLNRETAVWDKLLNRTYREVQSAFDADGKAYLKSTQTTWIRFRDQACEWPYKAYPGGSIAGPLSAECALNQTALRALDLSELQAALKER